jgi:hypothetical protein
MKKYDYVKEPNLIFEARRCIGNGIDFETSKQGPNFWMDLIILLERMERKANKKATNHEDDLKELEEPLKLATSMNHLLARAAAAITLAFNWKDSEEGEEYWMGIHNALVTVASEELKKESKEK